MITRLSTPKITLDKAVVKLFTRPLYENEIHLGSNYKHEVEKDIHRIGGGLFIDDIAIYDEGLRTINGNKNLTFEEAQKAFEQKIKKKILDEKAASKFSLMMTHLCNQGFCFPVFQILQRCTENSDMSISGPSEIGRTNVYGLKVVAGNIDQPYLEFKCTLHLYNQSDIENGKEDIRFTSRTISYKFFPDDTMQMSMDNPNDGYQELFEEFFIKLNSIDKKKDIAGQCQDEKKNIICNVLSSDIGVGKSKLFVKHLCSPSVSIKFDSENQRDQSRGEIQIHQSGKISIIQQYNKETLKDPLSEIDNHKYLEDVIDILLTVDYSVDLITIFEYRQYTIGQSQKTALHINKENNTAHVDFSLTLQKYDDKGKTNPDNDIELKWSFDHQGNAKLEMSGNKTDDYYTVYKYLHTTAQYDSKNTGDTLLRQNNPIAVEKLRKVETINKLLASNYNLRTYARLIDKDIREGKLNLGTHRLSDDIYNLLGKDTQGKLSTIAKELLKRHDPNKTTISSIGLKIKDFIYCIINYILNWFGHGVTEGTFREFTNNVFPHTDLEQDNKYTNNFVQLLQKQEERRQQSTDAQKIKID